MNVAIIIPYFQRQEGILRRALTAVLQQQLDLSAAIEIVVVDDGSPVPARREIEGLAFNSPFRLTLIEQPNGGVAAARNAGLQSLDGATGYIAFLDSDDIWHPAHLQTGLAALESGCDLYFCDNRRGGHYHSHFITGGDHINDYMRDHPATPAGIYEIGAAEVATFILKDFVTQPSTTIYRRAVAPDLLFNTTQRNAGEDMLFFMSLVEKAGQVCFSREILVDCGDGINLYWNNLDWESDGHLKRVMDVLRSHVAMRRQLRLSPENTQWNEAHIAMVRKDLAFHTMRKIVRKKGKWPAEIDVIRREDKNFKFWFPLACLQVLIGKATGTFAAN